MSEYVTASGLTVGYNGTPLIRDIALSIRRGEIVTLIGPNGSGKSTILKTLTRHLAAIGGTVTIDSEELSGITYKQLAKKMAVLLTDRTRPELMTCRDVVAMGRYPYTGSLGLLTEDDQKLISDAMDLVNVLELSDRDFQTLSDGQRQRVLLARAICQEPQIIVLDEPTSFLDIRYKVELFGILKKMAIERNTTVIMSLHEIDLAEKISDKILCVKGDHIEHFGTPEEIFSTGLIGTLYDISPKVFNPLLGSVEMPAPSGEPKTFVISACGSGIQVFRSLQKAGKPFAAGILYENDVDYQVASSLAAEVVTEKPFEEISEETYRKAVRVMDSCEEVIICPVPAGTGNARMRDLIGYARRTKACRDAG